MNILGWVLIGILVLAAAAVVMFFVNPVPQLGNSIKDSPWAAGATVVAAIALIFTAATFWDTRKLFVGQNTPMVDVTPVALSAEGNFTTIYFSIANYSGFAAHDIAIDLKLGDAWIMEWLKAHAEKEAKPKDERLIQMKTAYPLVPEFSAKQGPYWPRLEPGQAVGRDRLPGITGYLELQTICPEIGKGVPSSSHPVRIRVTWKNDNGHVFDEVHQYSLVCTLDQDKDEKGRIGYAFALIPDGIVSKKDSIASR